MTTKEYLEQYLQWQARKLNLLAERELIVIEEALPSGIDYSADRVQTSPDDGMAKKFIRIQKRTKDIDREVEKITDNMCRIKDELNAVTDAFSCRLLWLRYIEGLKWDKIAQTLCCSEEHARGPAHNTALSYFGKIKCKSKR